MIEKKSDRNERIALFKDERKGRLEALDEIDRLRGLADRQKVERGASPREIRLMRHMLGSSHPTSPLGWRNYGAWADDDPHMNVMVEKGLVTRGAMVNGGLPLLGGLRIYQVTDVWKEALGAKDQE